MSVYDLVCYFISDMMLMKHHLHLCLGSCCELFNINFICDSIVAIVNKCVVKKPREGRTQTSGESWQRG